VCSCVVGVIVAHRAIVKLTARDVVVGYTGLYAQQLRCPMLLDCCVGRQASGSGGTAGGIALGVRLAGHTDLRLHAFGVCDDPDYFYDYIDGLYADMGATPAAVGALQCSVFLLWDWRQSLTIP